MSLPGPPKSCSRQVIGRGRAEQRVQRRRRRRPRTAPRRTDRRRTLDDACLAPRGGGLGARAIAVLPESSCGLVETAHVARFLTGESAGQCGPCVRGLAAIAGALERAARLEGKDERAASGAGALRSAAAAPATTPTAQCGSWRAPSTSSPPSSTRTARTAVAPARERGSCGPRRGGLEDPSRRSHRVRRARPLRRALAGADRPR